MASSTQKSEPVKPNSGSRKVRIVAKIRGLTRQESQSSDGPTTPWISVRKPTCCSGDGGQSLPEKVAISFGDQPASHNTYHLDFCYEQNENVDLIFSKEIKPLIPGVFDGCNASVIAYGAKGSGKTYTIQGSEEQPGLASFAMAEILSMAKERENLVTVSLYEVFQEHVFDLLDPNHPEVVVLDDAHGKLNLKGLSQVSVKSISEFRNMYFTSCGQQKVTQKISLELPRRSHKGLLIHVLSYDGNSTKLVGKMNFVDLAGYEDARRKSRDAANCFEITWINKSLHALLNVVNALNTSESHVPYRESKLTRMLREFFEGTNHVLMLTFLNPFFCQDTMYMVSLASRSCQSMSRVLTDSTNKAKSSVKRAALSSNMKKEKPSTVSSTMRTQTGPRVQFTVSSAMTGSQMHFSNRKASGEEKYAREKLFDEVDLNTSKEAKAKLDDNLEQSNDTSKSGPCLQVEQERVVSDAMITGVEAKAKPGDNLEQSNATSISAPCLQAELEIAVSDAAIKGVEGVLPLHSEQNVIKVAAASPINCGTPIYSHYDGEENKNLLTIGGESPPLSARLREISNNLKSLCLTSASLKLTDEVSKGCANIVEPKTPIMGYNRGDHDKLETGSELKQFLVQDCLRFLNSASKEELKGLKGIGEKRSTYILGLREEMPEPFKSLDDLQDIGLTDKQVNRMMKEVAGGLFS